MIDEHAILAAERLRDDLGDLKASLRAEYDKEDATRSVDLRKRAARLAETWMVTLATQPDLKGAISSDYMADLNVRFQRLLTYSEHLTKRSKYDTEINAILQRFSVDLIIPLKQLRHTPQPPLRVVPVVFEPTAFVGHSFTTADAIVVKAVTQTLEGLGIKATTGEKPKAESISEKVKALIEGQHMFVGVFTRRDKIPYKQEWTTSPWVIDEKAYAVGKGKRLLLLKEQGVGSIGGIQGDYEHINFSRDALQGLIVQLIQVFELSTVGLKK